MLPYGIWNQVIKTGCVDLLSIIRNIINGSAEQELNSINIIKFRTFVCETCQGIFLKTKSFTQMHLKKQLLPRSQTLLSCQIARKSKLRKVVKFERESKYAKLILANAAKAFIREELLLAPDKEMVDCSECGSSGYAISGDLNLLDRLVMKTDARYIIIVEKHAIFQRLAEDRVFNHIPIILITARGYPDIATRFLLHRMSRTFPELPIMALVDWNPAGLAILCTFKFGSIGMGLEAYRYACNVKWLGLRGDDLQLIPEESFVSLKPRDLQIAKSLMSSETLQEKHREELALMVQSGKRAEIEALYFHGYDYLGKYIAKKIVQANYI
ncbi:hypothetical protein DKX38_000721 [Salix brachista]|uniref:Topoisomerase 6 subunit A/Spo11 TOPRIM domain-containing protein n=1 Tax=Salix brachista TaxID=2182728 RepID=A0A5N5P2V8_9ROSI|nr:hypothetical protein DKX38_000721 [Salix brachista]